MDGRAVRQRADVHNFEATQTILEVLEADVVGIHHFLLIATATEILTHHFSLFFVMNRTFAHPIVFSILIELMSSRRPERRGTISFPLRPATQQRECSSAESDSRSG